MLSIFAIIIVLLNMAFNALEFPFLVSLLMFALILSIALFVKSSLKRANASRKINLVVTISIIIVASLLIQAIITSNSFKNLDLYNQNSSDSNMVYKMANVNGKTIKVGMYKDAIPLKVEDLQEIKYDYYSYEMKKQVSFLLAHYEASQYVMGNAQNIPNLEYEILDVKWTPLYKLCISEFLKPKNWEVEKWRKINSEPWNADVAYQKSTHNGDINCYLICWENRIVEIRFDETPTENQISIAAKKLSTF